MSPRYIRCTAGHVYDTSLSNQCPHCAAMLVPQASSDDLFESVGKNGTGELQPGSNRAEPKKLSSKALRKYAQVAIVILIVLGGAIYFARLYKPDQVVAENSASSLKESAQPLQNNRSIDRKKEEEKEKEQKEASEKREEVLLPSDSSSKSSDTQANAKSSDSQNDPKTSPIAEPEADKAGQSIEASKGNSQEKPAKDLSSLDGLVSKLFPATSQAITELRRVRLTPIPADFKGWSKEPPQAPLPSSVSRSHSPVVYEFLEQNAVAKSAHWFTQGAVSLDPAVRVGCWEYAAFLGHPYAAWALCSHYEGSDAQRVQAWTQLAVERGVPHLRARLATGAEYYRDLNEVLNQVDALNLQADRKEAIGKLVTIIGKTCDLRIAARLYELEVLSQFKENAATSQAVEFNQALQQLHRMMFEEFEVRGALPPYFGFEENDSRLSVDIRNETSIEGVWGLLVPLHRIAVGSLPPENAQTVYEKHASQLPADQATRIRRTFGHIEKGLFAALASSVIDRIREESNHHSDSISWRKVQEPIEAWVANQGMNGRLKELDEQFHMSRSTLGLCQYLMARVADKRKKYDEASALYEASYINGMLLVSLDYARMLKSMSAESGMNQELFNVAETWDSAALKFQVLGSNFNRFISSLNDKKVSNEDLRLILKDSVRRGESQGDAFLSLLLGPDGEEILKNLGLTREEVSKFNEPTRQLVWRMQTNLPSSLNSAGLEARSKDVQTLVERAIDQDSWALLALGQRALPDPQFMTDMRGELILLHESLRRGNLSAMASAGRQSMFAEERLQLSPADKCIYGFAAWVLVDKQSAEPDLIQAYDSLFRETMSRIDGKPKERLLNWMSDIAIAFEKQL